jgi:hypothetical protein
MVFRLVPHRSPVWVPGFGVGLTGGGTTPPTLTPHWRIPLMHLLLCGPPATRSPNLPVISSVLRLSRVPRAVSCR